jgi:hypothetical protein
MPQPSWVGGERGLAAAPGRGWYSTRRPARTCPRLAKGDVLLADGGGGRARAVPCAERVQQGDGHLRRPIGARRNLGTVVPRPSITERERHPAAGRLTRSRRAEDISRPARITHPADPCVGGQTHSPDSHHAVNILAVSIDISYTNVDRVPPVCLHLRNTLSTSEYKEGLKVVRHGAKTQPTIAGSPPRRRPWPTLSVPGCASPEQGGRVTA